ncbi:MAG: sortase [Proteobacteria bacterium]|nr:sortase [Pseudomonadota bacterium]
MTENAKKFLTRLSNIFLILGIVLIFLTYYQIVFNEVKYRIDNLLKVSYTLESEGIKVEDKKSSFIDAKNIIIKPINTDFSIVIESINVSAPIISDVPIINKQDYLESLKKGVAHASFSDYPDNPVGKVYLFAHSSSNFWELGRYSSVFNLLHKLKVDSQINIFYKNKRYVYQVENIEYKKDFRVDETIYESIGPSLTLQTCHPPGTTLNRLIITSSLIKVE